MNELIKQVFSNPAGDKLLESWTRDLIASPSYRPGNTPEETAFNEGKKEFVRHIFNVLEEVKK